MRRPSPRPDGSRTQFAPAPAGPCSSTPRQAGTVGAMHSLPLPDRLRSHVEALTREGPRHPSNPEAVATTLAYLTQTLEAMGYRVGQVRYGPDPQNVNLLVEVPAIDARAPLLEVGAH